MENEQKQTAAQRILALVPSNSAPQSPAATDPGNAPKVAAPVPNAPETLGSPALATFAVAPPSSPAPMAAPAGSLETWEYTYPKPILAKHRPLVEAGTDPHKIDHAAWKRKHGCQCHVCKVFRSEAKRTDSAAGAAGSLAAGAPGAAAGPLIVPKFAGTVLALPERFMEAKARATGKSKQVQAVWKLTQEDFDIYDQQGRALMERYLNLPGFEHKELLLFVIFYSANLGSKALLAQSLEAGETPEKERA